MTDYTRTEIAVGAFVLAGIAALGFLVFSLGDVVPRLAAPRYSLSARFSTVGDLQPGAAVRLAGVTVGRVRAIELDGYTAVVRLEINEGLLLPTDSAAAIETQGLLGDAYVSLSPGGAEDNLRPGGTIARTEPPLSLRDLIGKVAFGEGGVEEPSAGGAPSGHRRE